MDYRLHITNPTLQYFLDTNGFKSTRFSGVWVKKLNADLNLRFLYTVTTWDTSTFLYISHVPRPAMVPIQLIKQLYFHKTSILKDTMPAEIEILKSIIELF